jgi:hypothetical protein
LQHIPSEGINSPQFESDIIRILSDNGAFGAAPASDTVAESLNPGAAPTSDNMGKE